MTAEQLLALAEQAEQLRAQAEALMHQLCDAAEMLIGDKP